MSRKAKRSNIKCDKCGKSFGNEYNLKRHILVHLNECTTCNKRCKTVEYLRIHMRVHSGKYECAVCAETFPNKWCFNRHDVTKCMTAFKYPCTGCKARFRSLNDLQQHMQTLHPINNKRRRVMTRQMTKTGATDTPRSDHRDLAEHSGLPQQELKEQRECVELESTSENLNEQETSSSSIPTEIDPVNAEESEESKTTPSVAEVNKSDTTERVQEDERPTTNATEDKCLDCGKDIANRHTANTEDEDQYFCSDCDLHDEDDMDEIYRKFQKLYNN